MQDGFFSLFLFFFSLATGKKKIKAYNLQLAGTEEISFRCLPTLAEEFCSPTLSLPPGHIISGLSAERCCPHPRAGQGVRGRAAFPSNANGSVFPDDNPYPSPARLSRDAQTLPATMRTPEASTQPGTSIPGRTR